MTGFRPTARRTFSTDHESGPPSGPFAVDGDGAVAVRRRRTRRRSSRGTRCRFFRNDALDLLRDLLVLDRKEAREDLDEDGLRPVAREAGRELGADGARADDEERLRDRRATSGCGPSSGSLSPSAFRKGRSRGTEPVAIRTFFVSSGVSPPSPVTATACGETRRPSPAWTSILFFFMRYSTPLAPLKTTLSRNFTTAGKSSSTPAVLTPNSAAWFFASSKSDADLSIAFVGMQPRWRQLPPSPTPGTFASFSTIAVLRPSCGGPDRGDVAAGSRADHDEVVRGNALTVSLRPAAGARRRAPERTGIIGGRQPKRMPRSPPARTSQAALIRTAARMATLDEEQRDRRDVRERRPRELERDGPHQGERRDVHAVEERAEEPRPPEAGHERAHDRDEREGGQEDAERRDGRARQAPQDVADERRRGRQRPGRELADGDGVEELRAREPVPALDEVGLQEGEEHVAAAEQDGSGLQEEEEEAGKRERRERNCCWRERRGREEREEEDFLEGVWGRGASSARAMARIGALGAAPLVRAAGAACGRPSYPSKKIFNRHHPNRDTTGNEQQQEFVDEERRDERGEAEGEEEPVLHRGAAEARRAPCTMSARTTGLMPSKKCGIAGSEPKRT